jgi:hypothetical protein
MGFYALYDQLTFVKDKGTACLEHLKNVNPLLLPTKEFWKRHSAYWSTNFSNKFLHKILQKYMDNVVRDRIVAKIMMKFPDHWIATIESCPKFAFRVASADYITHDVVLGWIVQYTFPNMPDQQSREDFVSIFWKKAYDPDTVTNLKKKKQPNVFVEFAKFLIQNDNVGLSDSPESNEEVPTDHMIVEMIEGKVQWMHCRMIIMKKEMITKLLQMMKVAILVQKFHPIVQWTGLNTTTPMMIR